MWRPAVVAAMALVLVACAVNPVTGRPELAWVSEEEEIAAGREGAEEVAAAMGLVDDEALVATVAQVGARVAAAAPARGFPYRFLVVDLSEPNAFALPGGHIYVSRGLLAITNSEDELANVLAHEVVHVAARHHAQRDARARGVGLLGLPGALAGALLGPIGHLVDAVGTLAGAGLVARYGRDQERQADRVGQEIAARAGYDPAALGTFLVTLEREMRLRLESPSPGSWLDSHPSTPERSRDATERAAQLVWQPRPGVAGDRRGFLARIDGLLLGENPAEGVFAGQRFLHPDLGFSIAFPEGWRTINARDAVGAIDPGGSLQAVVRVAARGDDPREAAAAFVQEVREHGKIEVARLEPLHIHDLAAVRGQALSRGRRGVVGLDLTWIAHEGLIYLVAGLVDGGYQEAHRALFGAVAGSFRPLREDERAAIEELRLRVRPARAGEDLAALGGRTGNAWSVRETAVANGLDVGARLAEGEPVKVAVRRVYPGAPGPP